jgi:hypothetical protein
MNETQLRDYLFSDHYKAWPVQEAIKPHTDYQQYVAKLGYSPDKVVVAFGSASGQTIPRSEAQYIRLKPNSHNTEYYYIRKSDVFQINTARLEQTGVPSDYLICCYTDDYRLYHPEDMVLTYDSNWLPKDICVVIEPKYYADDPDHDDPIYIYSGNSVETIEGERICSNDAIYCESDSSYYHQDNDEIQYCDARDYWVHPEDDNVVFCIDIDQYCIRHDAYYCDLSAEYYYYESNVASRDHTQTIQDYHCGVQPEFKTLEIDKNVVLSKYTIGFEVEKDCLRDGNADCGSLIEQQPLFSHWETDSSCGIEGITNVYSLDNYNQFINDVRSSDYTDLETNGRCGGHINFAHRENKLQYWHIRPWLGLIFSMWKKRLTNQYSSCNKKLNPYRGTDYHYGALVEKGRMRNNVRFELRLPNRVKDGDTLIRRFCLIRHLIQCVDLYINEDFSWMSAKYDDKIDGIPDWANRYETIAYNSDIEALLKVISPQSRQRTRFFFDKAKSIIMQGYSTEEYKRVLLYAYAFQSYIDEESPSSLVNDLTNPYINS